MFHLRPLVVATCLLFTGMNYQQIFASTPDIAEHARDTTRNATNFTVAAYLPEYRLDLSLADRICEHVTDLILFSAEPSEDGDVTMLNRFPKDYLDTLLSAREKYNTRISLSIGGGGRSRAFSSMTSSAPARRKFSLRILEICQNWRLDGIDLDWEGDLEKNPIKWKNLENLIVEIKSLFEEYSRSLHLTIAIHLGQEDSLTPTILKVHCNLQCALVHSL